MPIDFYNSRWENLFQSSKQIQSAERKDMAAEIIYFGEDHCHRVQVLRSAGFDVCHCLSLKDMRLRLCAPPDVGAVVADSAYVDSELQLVKETRALCAAPMVLFLSAETEPATDHFDLIIPSLTSPQLWLKELSKAMDLQVRMSAEQSSRRPPLSNGDAPSMRERVREDGGTAESVPMRYYR